MEEFLDNVKIDIENVLYTLPQYSENDLNMPEGTGPYYIDENYLIMYYHAFRYMQLNVPNSQFCHIEPDSYYLVHPYILLPRSIPFIQTIAIIGETS